MLRLYADDDAWLFLGHETEPVLNEDAVWRVDACTAFDQLAQHLLSHRQIRGVVDAADGPAVLLPAHDAEELNFCTLTRRE